MNIEISNLEVCLSCNKKDCSFCNSIVSDFKGLRTETTVCPTTVLSDGPLETVHQDANLNVIKDDNCINCGLCILGCHQQNLRFINENFLEDSFAKLSEQQSNAIACSYLYHIFGLSANTNRNKALQFDGYVNTTNGEEAFVEIDKDDDSLESVRRLLGDFLLYGQARNINIGIVVLNSIPSLTSRDVISVLKSIADFPHTKELKIYFTTFKILRMLAFHCKGENLEFSDYLLDLSQDNCQINFVNKICQQYPELKNVVGPMVGLI